MLQVEVPAGVGPGEQFMAQIPGGGTALVTVPDGCSAGTMISIETVAAPSQMAMARTPEQELLQKAIMQIGNWKGHFRSPEAAICCMLIKAEATVDNGSITWKPAGCDCCCIPCPCGASAEPFKGTIDPSGTTLKIEGREAMGLTPDGWFVWTAQLDPNHDMLGTGTILCRMQGSSDYKGDLVFDTRTEKMTVYIKYFSPKKLRDYTQDYVMVKQ